MDRKAILWLIAGVVGAALSLSGLIFTRLYIIAPYTCPSRGMEPSIKRGSLFFILKIAYRQPESVKRGDIIAYRSVFTGTESIYIQRVIGIPGDHITTTGTMLKINGVDVERHEIGQEGELHLFEEKLGNAVYKIQIGANESGLKDVDVTVPDDCFFLLGDNRTNSLDSRYTGCVEFEDIVGEKL